MAPQKQTRVGLQTQISKERQRRSLILIKVAIHQEEITIVNLYAPNFFKLILLYLKTQIDPNTVVMDTSVLLYHQ
jgi:hypothetical protein